MNTASGHSELLNTTVTAWCCLLGSDLTMAVHSTLFSGDGVTSKMMLGTSQATHPVLVTPTVGPLKCTNQCFGTDW
ncbi:hypothetical protein E2C01_031887 [Portunus trituberculatus]|uniref:Uncharacterized protein n=1 Tax=Portunus trituberculatus TaxID=210409 RepID=A0A5B7EVZ0_PORTR|nr:hypothetical protein [Portunus trituberculatus]